MVGQKRSGIQHSNRVSEVTAFIPAPRSWQGEDQEKVTKRNPLSPPPERKGKELGSKLLPFPHFRCPGP